MQAVQFGRTTIDRCLHCHGLWFDRHEIDRARTDASPRTLDPGHPFDGFEHNTRRDAHCPRCDQKLLKLAFPVQTHIDYEQCSHCGGAFLDAGEFTDLATLTRSERLRLWWRQVQG